MRWAKGAALRCCMLLSKDALDARGSLVLSTPLACTPTHAEALGPLPPAAERTVALLVFEDVKSSPLADLMDVAQRQKTASELNAAILASQSQASSVARSGWAGDLQSARCDCHEAATRAPPFPCLQEAEPKLPNLLKLLIWAQKQLDEKAVYPRIDNLVTAELVEHDADD